MAVASAASNVETVPLEDVPNDKTLETGVMHTVVSKPFRCAGVVLGSTNKAVRLPASGNLLRSPSCLEHHPYRLVLVVSSVSHPGDVCDRPGYALVA